MKSLRARLFLSVGAIFLVIAILSYFVPKVFIRKDINTSGWKLNNLFESYHAKMQTLASNWVTYRMMQTAAQLSAVINAVPAEGKDAWELATTIVGYDPQLAFVQVTGKETAVISVESGVVYVPAWARDAAGKLWIQIPGSQTSYEATFSGEGTYLLVKGSESEALNFVPFEQELSSFSLSDAPKRIYDALKWRENVLLQKAAVIKELAANREKAAGIMKVDPSFKQAGAILAADIFLSTPLVTAQELRQDPFILFRKEGPYVDIVQQVKRGGNQIAVAFSISQICSDISRTIERPILLYNHEQLLQAFDDVGRNLPLDTLQISDKGITWQGQVYFPSEIAVSSLTVAVLTPETFLQSVTHLLNTLRDGLIAKISLTLLWVALLLLILALLLLARISKNITKPITLLALASEEIGDGKYEGLHLPPTEGRHDEVTILTESFGKMVVSLQEREKIRGVLNKVVSKEIATEVLRGAVELGGEERTLTMLFSDIRGFTPLSETMTPPTLIALLNTYMTRMCRIVDQTHGVVDKFVGDEIMALYGAPLELANHAEKAVEAALLMLQDLRQWNQEKPASVPQITIGIGIHTGIAFSGNMGAENRLNYTVVGANVNLAARLCSAALPMQVLISEATYNQLPNPGRFPFQKLSPITLKGIDHPVPIYGITL